MGSDVIQLIIIVVCIIMSAYFSATETAFSSLNKIRIKNKADKGNKKAKLVMYLSDNYDSVLSTILIGNNIVNILSASLSTVLFVNMLGNDIGPSVSTIVLTIVILIFGEVTPKSIAKESPEKFAMFSAPFLKMLVIILTPFNYLFGLWKKVLSLIIKPSEDNGITEEELLTIVDVAEQDGGINEQESMLIRSAIEFDELEAIDILTPRIDITALSVDSTKEEIAKVFADTAFSRIPLYEETIDHIVGIIYQKDFYNYVYNTEKNVKDIIRPAVFVPSNKRIGSLLKELQQKKLHIAVVLDEFGGTVGIVTLEDILEELVGEIWDEHDEVSKEIECKTNGEYIVLGNANVDKLFEELDVKVSEEIESVTVNGWVMEQLGRIPKKDDSFEYQNYRVLVLEMNENRVEKVQVIKEEKRTEETKKEK